MIVFVHLHLQFVSVLWLLLLLYGFWCSFYFCVFTFAIVKSMLHSWLPKVVPKVSARRSSSVTHLSVIKLLSNFYYMYVHKMSTLLKKHTLLLLDEQNDLWTIFT